MPLDVITISALRDELSECITGMRVDKIMQPARDIVIFLLRRKTGEQRKLLISTGMADARIHLTKQEFENPAAPPMFCMLLRKHLTGAEILSVNQPDSERIIELSLKASSVMGEISDKRLLVELFGRVPNIILIGEEGIIIDCMRRISGDADGKRMILPGLRYRYPEPVCQGDGSLDTNSFVCQENRPPDTPAISEYLDVKYTIKSKDDSMRQRGAMITKTIKTAHKRISRKLKAQRDELRQTENRDYLRESADIIMANLHLLKKGDTILVADDFYTEEGAKREIELDPLLMPQKNAAKYYKKYTKARNAVEHLTGQITAGERELEYIESVLDVLSRAESEKELDEVRRELIQSGYLKEQITKQNKKQNAKAKKLKNPAPRPYEMKSSTGMTILVGKSNVQNDVLTMKTAARTDIWLHAQKIQGAHVVIKAGTNPPDDVTLREAASIAAYYSSGRGAGKIPVDYTQVKYVKKPPGAKPGMVTYSNFKTIIADSKDFVV